MDLKESIKKCNSVSDFCKILNLHINGTGIRKAKKIINDNNLDTSHFGLVNKNRKHPIIDKECPVCGKNFKTQTHGDKKEKYTCSYSCSNTYFRSGVDNPNWRETSSRYRDKCFEFHKKECVVCSENKIVEVHHIDEDRTNNKMDNLVPLCPTHHGYWHSRYKIEIEELIYTYINKFKEMTTIQQQQQQQINLTD